MQTIELLLIAIGDWLPSATISKGVLVFFSSVINHQQDCLFIVHRELIQLYEKVTVQVTVNGVDKIKVSKSSSVRFLCCTCRNTE